MSTFDYNTLLDYGESNATHLKDLCSALGLSEWELKSSISQARSDGTPILSSSAGYFLPQTKNECRAFINGMKRKIIAHQKAITCIKNYMKNHF